MTHPTICFDYSLDTLSPSISENHLIPGGFLVGKCMLMKYLRLNPYIYQAPAGVGVPSCAGEGHRPDRSD